MKYILSIDQGTTSSRSIIFNDKSEIIAVAQQPYEQIFPTPGWVEHNPLDIWNTQLSVMLQVLRKSGITAAQIAALGIANQRETTILWDRTSGEPVYNAIVWQDRRTADYCTELREQGLSDLIQSKTGLVIDSYFSATKIKWILDNVDGVRQRAERGEICFGTVDSWLVWNLTNGAIHITDASNASRTMLYNIHTGGWDEELLQIFSIPPAILPSVRNSSEVYGLTSVAEIDHSIPIAGIAGDQQAALFGQLCLEPGMLKTTYGTGCFMVMNTGNIAVKSQKKLLTTVGWQIDGAITYALEGSVFIGGAAIQWLRDGLHLFTDAAETEAIAQSVSDNGGVYFVPALSGLGAPYWDSYARGTIVGITRGTTTAHFVRAALEGIAFQVNDVLMAMQDDVKQPIKEMRVDGGAVANNFLMQFQSDISSIPVVRPVVLETTALGAAYLAGLAVGFWNNIDTVCRNVAIEKRFEPEACRVESAQLLRLWSKAVGRSLSWEE